MYQSRYLGTVPKSPTTGVLKRIYVHVVLYSSRAEGYPSVSSINLIMIIVVIITSTCQHRYQGALVTTLKEQTIAKSRQLDNGGGELQRSRGRLCPDEQDPELFTYLQGHQALV